MYINRLIGKRIYRGVTVVSGSKLALFVNGVVSSPAALLEFFPRFSKKMQET